MSGLTSADGTQELQNFSVRRAFKDHLSTALWSKRHADHPGNNREWFHHWNKKNSTKVKMPISVNLKRTVSV